MQKWPRRCTHDHVPVFFSQAQEHAVAQHASVVDDDVHIAKSSQRGIQNRLRTGHCGDVARVGNGLTACGLDLIGHGRSSFGTDVVDHHICTLLREGQRVSAAQAACTGDDDGSLVANTHFFPLCLLCRAAVMPTLPS